MANQKYIIANLSDVSEQMWEDSYQEEDIPHISNDGLRTILSYTGTKPSSFGTHTVYTNDQIIQEMIDDPDSWYVEVDEDGNIITGD